MGNKKFVLKRHEIFKKIVGLPFLTFQKKQYNIKVTKFDNKDNNQYLILFNHTTTGDQFFLYMAFDFPLYLVASEDILTNGFSSKLLSYFTGPIPIKKNATDVRAVKQCLRVAKEGGSIALAPEGNRTYSGATGYMNPAIVKLARALKLPILLFRIEGGYGKKPRWSDNIRSGKMKAYVSSTITVEEMSNMSDEELLNKISKGLYIDESKENSEFYSKKSAEYMERLFYFCPDCGFSVFTSKDDIITCNKCGNSIRYLKNKKLEGINKPFKYTTPKEWYDAQEDFINNVTLDDLYKDDEIIYQDNIKLLKVIPYKRKEKIDKNAISKLYKDRIEIEYNNNTLIMEFKDIATVSVIHNHKLNVYYKDDVYQFQGDVRFNAIKYMHFYYKNLHRVNGDLNNKFLGL